MNAEPVKISGVYCNNKSCDVNKGIFHRHPYTPAAFFY
jgi:hypothetical protein